MYTIRKKFRVEYAHQLLTAYSQCCTDQIHGHSGILEIFLTSSILNSDGMVSDFGAIKELIGKYIQSWDHSLIMPSMMDKKYLNMLKKHNQNLIIVDYNPTAENMARQICEHIKIILFNHNLKGASKQRISAKVKVRFHETDSGYAEYED